MFKLLLIFALCTSSAFAVEQQVQTEKRSDLSVAIYNDNLALINDIRITELTKGINDVAFLDVSALIRPETALVKGSGFVVKEQNFNFDLLSYYSLLEKSLGQKVTLEYINPGNGDKTVEEGEIISNANGSLVLKIGDRIETNYPGRVIFHSIPKTLRSKPTLVLSLDAKKSGKTMVSLSYLTKGLSWKTDYVAEMNQDENALDINGLVTLTNNSGVAYENASMQLIAGDINQIKEVMYKTARSNAPMMTMEMAYADGGVAAESFMDFYLYNMPSKVNINDKQTKQISLLSGKARIEKEYTYRNLLSIYNSKNSSDKFEKINPAVKITFKNDKDEGLGIPLPAGVFRVYKADKKGQMLFVGEDKINHTPKNEKVDIDLGKAFDITASGKKVDFKSFGSKKYEAEYEISIKNAKTSDIVVDVYQYIPNGAKIVSENIKSIKETANDILWRVKVSKESDTKLKFKVMVEDN